MSLEFTLNRDAATTAPSDCVVVGAFADNSLTPSAQAIDGASGGRLAALLERGDVVGKTGRTALLHDVPGVAAPRVLVIGLGERDKFGVPQYIKAVGDAARALRTGPVRRALFTLSELPVAHGLEVLGGAELGAVAQADHQHPRRGHARQVVQEGRAPDLAADVAAADERGDAAAAGGVERLRGGAQAVVGEGAHDDAIGGDAHRGSRAQREFEGHRGFR